MKTLFLLFFSMLALVGKAQQDCEINTINPDFEEPVIAQSGWPTFVDASGVLGWGTTAPDNQIEIWPHSTNGGGVMAFSGDQYIELNANYQSGVFQDYDTPVEGIVFNYSFAHCARNLAASGFDVVGVFAGPPSGPLIELGQYSSEVWTGWNVFTGSYSVPSGQPVTRFEFRAIDTAYGDNTVGNFLDAIEFTSNFGLASDPEISLSCENNIATGIVAVGTGNWTINPGNPSPTTIDNLTSNTPTITGFDLSGDYYYTWSNGFCEAELVIHYANEAINILDEHLEKEICESDTVVNLTLYQTEISVDPGVFFLFYENFSDAEDGNGNFVPDPANYVLTANTTLYVRVTNEGFCTEIVQIDLELVMAPDIAPEINLEPKCDEDLDGMVEFNLDEEVFPDIYDDPIYSITYHLSETDAQNGLNPQSGIVTLIPGDSAVYWARVSVGDCWAVSQINLDSSLGIEGVTLQTELFPQSVCDDDFDGIILVNLTFWEEYLISDSNSVTFYYYLSETDAIAGTNPIVGDLENYPLTQFIFWVILVNEEGCREMRFIEFVLNDELENVTNQEDIEPVTICDEDFNGIIYVDLTYWEEVLFDNLALVAFEFFLDELDAISGTNPITGNLENYPISQTTFWIVVSGESGCKELRQVQYEIGEPVQTNGILFNLPDVCLIIDYSIDLTQLETEITDEINVDFFYYETLEQAQIGGDNYILNPGNYTVLESGSVFIRIQSNNSTKCPIIVELRFELGSEVPHEPQPYILSGICEDLPLNLTEIVPQITTNGAVSIIYFESENEAILNQNPIINYTEYNPSSNSGTLYVRLELIHHCPVVLPFDFERALLPQNPFTSFPTFCPGNELLLDAGEVYPNENYEWNWDGGTFVGAELTISEPGNYQLTITTIEGCTDTFDVVIAQPEPPVITNIIVGSTYIIVETGGNGTSLEFSLDGVFWQSNPRFDNLTPGEKYTVYVRESGCDPISKTVSILYITNFISPNGDGKNDTWTIRGLDISSECSVKIFDRYGKIFVDSGFQISDNFNWNGKYKGEAVPSGDYWYIITTRNEDLVEMKYIGHISVRNRD